MDGTYSEFGIKSEVVLPTSAEDDMEDADLEKVKRALGMTEEDEDDDDQPTTAKSGVSGRSLATTMESVYRHPCWAFFVWLADHVVFTSVFMVLTFYALFAPDVDQLCGNKTSRLVMLILNTLVCLAFIFEIVVMSLGKEKYFFRPYFLLDTVALVSMLPETWVMQVLMGGQSGFAAGRSSRIARIIRVASRSSKATRLNRLTRIARVASLLPKFGKLFGHRVNEQEVKSVLNKKLNRVFRLFDDDMDSRVARGKITRFLDSLKVDIVRQSTKLISRPSKAAIQQSLGLGSKQSRSSTFSRCTVASKDTGMSAVESDGSQALNNSANMSEGTATGSTTKGKRSTRGGINWADNHDELDESDMVNFQEFKEMMLQDPIVGPRLRNAVDVHLRRRTNTKNITTRHSEYVAVRVALGVILLLFLLGIVAPDIEDQALEMGLEFMVETMRLQYPNATVGSPIPDTLHQQVKQFRWNVRASDNRKVLWIDVNHLTYCDAFNYGEPNCTWNGAATAYWGRRESLIRIDDFIGDSEYRAGDMERIRTPEIDEDISDDEMNARTIAVAVIDDRGQRQMEAAMSICTTFLIILVILVGIYLLTQDLTQMSSQLLKPLRELADDMESLTQLQLAGAEDVEEVKKGQGTDEIRQIRNTFEKMKKAIKSWGKYVPWPVVSMLLRTNVEAVLKVEEVEASMYFSDIAGFTTIVEQLQPEKSLLLLNRYFNDMTKVIDDHGGVVIEFIGDAILCIYGQPLLNPYHPSAAVKGALRMLSVLRKLNAWSVQKGLPEVNIRCGVHTGQVLVGNMGFQSRIKYGIVGEDSQIPSRLEELNKTYTSNCLISHSTFYQLVDNMFISRPVDWIRLRHAPGSEPEYIHQVMDRFRGSDKSHPLWQACEVHAEAMEHYKQCEFEEAIGKFEQAGELVKAHLKIEEDGPSALLIKRCEALIKEPPPEDWDGVWVEDRH